MVTIRCPECNASSVAIDSVGYTVRQPDGVTFHSYRVCASGALGRVSDDEFTGNIASVVMKCANCGYDWHRAFVEFDGEVTVREVPVAAPVVVGLDLATLVPAKNTHTLQAAINNVWTQLIVAVETEAPMVATWLKVGKPLGINDGALWIDFHENHTMLAGALALPSNLGVVVTKLRDILHINTAAVVCCINGKPVRHPTKL
jgi:hypothetical protein